MVSNYEPLGRRLTELLTEQYRRSWFRHADLRTARPVSPRAVAKMLMRCVTPEALELGLDDVSEDALETRVRRLLDGKNAGPATLEALITCAGFTPADAKEVRQLCANARAGHPVNLTSVGRTEFDTSLTTPRQRIPDASGASAAPLWATLQVDERHTVDAEGLPVCHVTRQTIEALGDVDRYPYLFDTNAASVTVLEGGIAGPVRRVAADLFGVDIVFGRRLARGEQWPLEFETRFDYDQMPTQEFRRASQSRHIPSVDMRVSFHPDKLPGAVWWATWESLADPAHSRREPVELVGERAFRHTSIFAGTAVGFMWDF